MYEDGSSCDEEYWNNKADAEAEYRSQKEWDVEKMIADHLLYHHKKYGTPFSSWDKEDVLCDLAYKLDHLFCNDVDDFFLDDYIDDEDIEKIVERVILNQERYI